MKLKGDILRIAILCLLLCLLGSLSSCEKAEENSSKKPNENHAIKDNEKIEEVKKSVGLVKTPSHHTLNVRLREMYEAIWQEYVSVQECGGYHEKIWEEIGIQPYAIWLASVKDEEDTLYYSFIDINKDGTIEMLIGRDWVSSISLFEGMGYPTSHLEGIHLITVYYYHFPSGKVREGGVSDRAVYRLYEGGILEYFYSEILYENYMYYILDEEGWKLLDELDIREEYKIPEEAPKNVDPVYIRTQEQNGEEERNYITEEEFYAIQQEYATTPMQIDWKSFADIEENQRMKEYF